MIVSEKNKPIPEEWELSKHEASEFFLQIGDNLTRIDKILDQLHHHIDEEISLYEALESELEHQHKLKGAVLDDMTEQIFEQFSVNDLFIFRDPRGFINIEV
jgi:hypothetical protein